MEELNKTYSRVEKPKLLDQVRFAIRTKHYSIRTEQAYTAWIRKFILFHNKRHPIEMGEVEIGQFVTDLAVEKNVAASTQNQALSAIHFLIEKCYKKRLAESKTLSGPNVRKGSRLFSGGTKCGHCSSSSAA